MNRTEGREIQFVLDARDQSGPIVSDKCSQKVLAGFEKEEVLVDIGRFTLSLLPSNLNLISNSGLSHIQRVSGQYNNLPIQTASLRKLAQENGSSVRRWRDASCISRSMAR